MEVLVGVLAGVGAGVFLGRFLAHRQFSRIERLWASKAVARRAALAEARSRAVQVQSAAAELQTEDFRRPVATAVLTEPPLELAEFRRRVLTFEATPN